MFRATLATLVLAAAAAPVRAADPPRPNFVIVLADDMGWGDLAANGSNKIVKTPHLDDMAAKGVRFTHFRAASPLCSPTRAALMSGRYPTRYGSYVPKDVLPGTERTAAEYLEGAGYATGHFGKWHIGDLAAKSPTSPAAQGFDTYFTIYNSYQVNKFDTGGFATTGGGKGVVKGYCEDGIMDEAMKFVRTSVYQNKPFLAVVCNMAPHSPHQAPQRLRALYPDQPLAGQEYWGMISSVDENVGRMRALLRELKVADDTLFLFTSDNGGAKPSKLRHPFTEGKGHVWDGGLRVPGVVEWPGRVKKGFVTEYPAYTCDVLPTLLAAAGVKPAADAKPLDGISILAALVDPKAVRPSPIVFHFDDARGLPAKGKAKALGDNGFAVVDGRFKLLTDVGGTAARLFDVTADPGEKTDLTAEHPDVAKRLQEAKAAWWASVTKEPGYQSQNGPKK